MKTVFIVEKGMLSESAAEQAEESGVFGEIDKVLIIKSEEPEKAKTYMKNRLRMSDGDDIRFMVFGFDKEDFSDVKDRKGEPVIKYKGVIKEKEK